MIRIHFVEQIMKDQKMLIVTINAYTKSSGVTFFPIHTYKLFLQHY